MSGQNMDQFEEYFKRADFDGDGKISGHEAVAFFQGSGLSKQVLAQIWTYADQARIGFLGQAEFYNALKLVTVAQSRRELTPDIVKAALYGPAAAKIPPPKIALPATPTNQSNSMAATSVPSMGGVTPPASQNFGFRGPGVPNSSMNQPYFPSQQSRSMRPPQAIPDGQLPLGISGPGGGTVSQTKVMSPSFASVPHQVMPVATAGLGALSPNISNDWLSGRTGGAPTGPRGVRPSIPSATSQPQNLSSTTSQSTTSDSRVSVVSGNGSASYSFFGGDMFSVATSTTKQGPSIPSYPASSAPASSAIAPVSSGAKAQNSAKPRSLDALQGAFAMQPLGSQPLQVPPTSSIGPQHSGQSMPILPTSGISVVKANSSDSPQLPWPKMKPSDVQKYMKIFMDVDDDRDGRITGEQARILFLSWRLPIEVLKQVWDLSDQDNDSMLSLKEFCFALYLMERYKEGRPLPAALPSNIMFDETLSSMTGQPRVAFGNAAWGSNSGFGQQQVMGALPITAAPGLGPPLLPTSSLAAGATTSNQQKAGAVLDDSFEDQLANGKHKFTTSKLTDGMAAEKADGRENLILDSKEKIEFYRTKMQELILYKSRCDNRLNEITERALADKREAELLGKKHEEKYKQVAEIASKLTIEEATFREIQERKMELHQAIIKMEQGGSADGILQVRADRIHSDLEELVKVLTECCKKHGLDVKSTAVIELPFGWQPGIQENAAVWDEEWDKFEDEGFANDLTVDVKNISISPKSRSANAQREKASSDGSLTPNSSSNADGKSGNLFSPGEHDIKSQSAYAHSEDESLRSPGRSAQESPSHGFSDVFAESTETDAETHRSFDESWGAASDAPDDTDSVWGFNPSNSKDSDSEKHRDFFGSSDFGVSTRRIESPTAETAFHKEGIFFEESAPATPASRFGNSSPRYSESGDHFDSFSRFDSFGIHGGRFSPQRDKFSRFDSINSTKDFGQGHGFSSFDDADPFASGGSFEVSSEHQSPKKVSQHWINF